MVANNRFVSILLGLALTSLVRGACDKSVEINTAAELAAIKDCKSFTGNIQVTDKFEGPFSLPVLEKIVGDINIASNKVNAVVLPQLTDATKFTLKSASLHELNLKLTNVDELNLDGLEGSFPVTFSPGLTTAKIVKILNNHIISVAGLNFKEVSHLEVLANTVLKSLDLPHLETAKGLFSFQGNEVASLNAPNLHTVKGETTLIKVRDIDLSKLAHTSFTLKVSGGSGKNYVFPELQYAHGGVIIEDCSNLESVSFPNLEKIDAGGFNLINNSKLNVVEIPKLINVDGGFNVAVPTLTDFKFNDKLTSQAEAKIKSNVDCTKLDKLKSQFGKFECEKANVAVVIPPGPTVTPTPNPGTNTGNQTPATPAKDPNSALSAAIPTFSAFALIVLTLFH